MSLTFNDINFNPVVKDNQIWLASPELSKALGYKRASTAKQIFQKNSAEFSNTMFQIIDDPHNPYSRMQVFSPRGCHLIAMFARTKQAKGFRRWVLDVLEKKTVGYNNNVIDQRTLCNCGLGMIVSNRTSSNDVILDIGKILPNRKIIDSNILIIGSDNEGNMILRELRNDEFITTIQDLPKLIANHCPYDIMTLFRIDSAVAEKRRERKQMLDVHNN